MAFDDTDRRRFRLAAIVSLLALPALWWINLDDPTTGPNTASVGVDVSGSGTATSPDTAAVPTVESTIGQSNLPTEPTVFEAPPIFLDGPTSQIGGIPQIAVPDPGAQQTVITRATFDELSGSGVCLGRDLPSGQTITVINLDNNRRVSCRLLLAPFSQQEQLVMDTSMFTELADLTDAPIPIEIQL